MNSQIQGVLQSVLSVGAGYLVGKGYFDSASANELVGALLALSSAVWSIFSHRAALNATPPAK